MLDARRDEVFLAAYLADGSRLLDARAVARTVAGEEARRIAAENSIVVVGEVAAELGLEHVLRSSEADLPHAIQVARLGAGAPVPTEPVQPKYVRGPNATLPDLPPSPLASPARG
jgi:tRNA A37 threonylcarbamoyladenosine modification protein TsaB